MPPPAKGRVTSESKGETNLSFPFLLTLTSGNWPQSFKTTDFLEMYQHIFIIPPPPLDIFYGQWFFFKLLFSNLYVNFFFF